MSITLPIIQNIGKENQTLDYVDSDTHNLILGKIDINTYIDEEVAVNTIEKIDFITKYNINPIVLSIFSNGGCVTSTFAIIDKLIMSKRNIVTINQGMAASCAAVLLLAGDAGSRYVYPSSLTMLHYARTKMETGFQTVSDLNHTTEVLKRFDKLIFNFVKKQTKKPNDKIKEWLSKDTYFSANEAIKDGLADKIYKNEVFWRE